MAVVNGESTEAEILRSLMGLHEEMIRLSGKMDAITHQVNTVDGLPDRVRVIETRVNSVGLDTLPMRLTVLETRAQSAAQQAITNRWLIGTIVVGLVTFLGFAATHLSWR